VSMEKYSYWLLFSLVALWEGSGIWGRGSRNEDVVAVSSRKQLTADPPASPEGEADGGQAQTDTDVSIDRINKMYRMKASRCGNRLKGGCESLELQE